MGIRRADPDTHVSVMEIVLSADTVKLAGALCPGIIENIIAAAVVVVGVE